MREQSPPMWGRKEQEKWSQERADALTPEEIESMASSQLSELGLGFDDLQDKTVLDVGSGQSVIERFAVQRGIENVLSLDVHLHTRGPTQLRHGVAGDSRLLPFRDESADLLIASNGVPFLAPGGESRTKETVEAGLHEMLRVLKNNGQARITPIALRDFLPKREQESQSLSPDEERKIAFAKKNAAKQKTVAFLKEQGYPIEAVYQKKKDVTGSPIIAYLVLRKKAEKEE